VSVGRGGHRAAIVLELVKGQSPHNQNSRRKQEVNQPDQALDVEARKERDSVN